MYKSRKRYGNNNISIAIDTTTGEILELVNKKSGDNLIKSTPFSLPNLFVVQLGATRLSIPNLINARENPELIAQISDNKDNGGTAISIIYNKLTDGKTVFDISIEITVFIPDNSGKLEFNAKVINNSGFDVESFCFPVLGSIYLGDTYKDDTLVYPFNAGMKFHNPVDYFAKKPKTIFWRWQEYRYCYNLEGCCGYKNSDSLYSYSSLYSGALSMAWLDLYDEHGGIYFGMHERNGICRLKAETLGPDSPGMMFSIEKTIESKENFSLNNIVIALHEGDWHDGADIYRQAHNDIKTEKPSWWKDSVSLVAHYDFKYQNGGIVHHFKDIPSIVDQAKSLNTDHILISGWHTDGFDNGFPEYFADKDLGTEKELAEGLNYAARNNIKVSFYINSRIANRKFVHLKEFIDSNVVVRHDGSQEIESYGDKSLSFATMCAGSEDWQNRIIEAIQYVVDLGATGVYLDQLGMAAPRTCHNPEHNHPVDGWCDGYRDVIKQARSIRAKNGDKISIIIEGCSDIYNDLVSGSLVSTFMTLHTGAFPELYRYTFPNQRLLDMVYPKQNLAMRPVHVAQRSSYLINKTFITDMYFWIYDLEEDNSFFGDPEQLEYLKKVLELKRKWNDKYKNFVFSDEKGISEKSTELSAKTYFKDDICIIAFASDGKTVCELKTEFNGEIIESNCIGEEDSVTEELDPERCYIRIAYSRCGYIVLKMNKELA